MRILSRLLLSLALVGSALPALAFTDAEVATGLGQAWPNRADVSASPRFHVYIFERSGIRYVQVNDLGGTVRGAFGIAGSEVFILPIGADAARLGTLAEPLPSWHGAGVRAYDDGVTKVLVAPQTNGTMQLMAMPSQCQGDPAECAVHRP